MSRVSVIVLNLDGAAFLPSCLAALRRQTQPFELIVVDNGSTDGSPEFVRAQFPDAQLILLGENRGFATANNIAIEQADGDYIALLNNDAVPACDWLEELLACIERHPRAAAAGSKTLLADEPALVDGAGDECDWRFLPVPRGHGQHDDHRWTHEVEVVSVSGAACLWRASALAEIGVFDERYFMYYEDVDLSLRARLLGWECWYAPRSVAVHHRGRTTAGRSYFTLYLPVKNRWYTIMKNVPAGLLLRRAPRLARGEAHWLLVAARQRRPHVLLRAYIDIVRNLRPVLRDRRMLLAKRRLSNQQLDSLLGG